MQIWSYKYFVPLVVLMFVGLASYAIIGLVLNCWALDKGSIHGNWPLNERPGIVVLMVVQGLFLLVSAIGLAGVFWRNIVIWYIPGFFLLGSGVTLLAFGTVSLRESSRDLTLDIFQTIHKANGTRAEQYLHWLSTVQWEHDCCGVISYKDYLQFNISSLQNGSVPDTCCSRKSNIPAPNCGKNILVPEKNIFEIEQVLITNGCGRIISEMQGQVLRKLGLEMLIVGIAALCFAFFLNLGIFKVVALEYAEEEQEDGAGNDDAGTCLSQTAVSSTTAANTSANCNPTVGLARNAVNRRIYRTRRHGGGESIVSFAVDLENNNVGNSSGASQGQQTSAGRKGQRRVKERTRAMTPRSVKTKGQLRKGQRGGNQWMSPGFRNENNDSNMEMLMRPRDNNSILSTTPYPSTHNFIAYFRQNQDQSSRIPENVNGNSGGTLRPTGVQQPQLSHYSSLPHVQTPISSVSKVDPKGKVMAELKQRFPPRGTSVQGRNLSPPISVVPPVTSQTQHRHYYRIPFKSLNPTTPDAEPASTSIPASAPPPLLVERKFPSRLVIESSLPTIQEEAESNASTLVPQSSQDQHVSIFQVFEQIEPNEAQNDSDQAKIGQEEGMDMAGAVEPNSVLVIQEDTDGLENESKMTLDCPNGKIEMEPIDTLVYI